MYKVTSKNRKKWSPTRRQSWLLADAA